MAGFIFLKLNNHEICQNTALRSGFPLIVYFNMGTDNCNVPSRAQTAGSRSRFPAGGRSAPEALQRRAAAAVPDQNATATVKRAVCAGGYLFYQSNLSVGSGISTNGG